MLPLACGGPGLSKVTLFILHGVVCKVTPVILRGESHSGYPTRGCIPADTGVCPQISVKLFHRDIILCLSRATYRPPIPNLSSERTGHSCLRWLFRLRPASGPLSCALASEDGGNPRTPPPLRKNGNGGHHWCGRSRVQSPAGMLRFHLTQCTK